MLVSLVERGAKVYVEGAPSDRRAGLFQASCRARARKDGACPARRRTVVTPSRTLVRPPDDRSAPVWQSNLNGAPGLTA